MKTVWTLLLILLLATLAGASTVTFDTFSPMDTCLPTVSSEGLTFTGPADTCNGDYMYVWDASAPNSNGTPGLIYGFTQAVAVTQTGGGPFTLNSVDMTISFYDGNTSEDVPVTAFLQGGGTINTTIVLIQGMQTYQFNFGPVTEVDFGAVPSGSGYWLMDNVVYNGTATPEPGTLLMLGSGVLTGIGVLRRKLL